MDKIQKLNLALNTIKAVYGDRVARRSQVPLMNHITEGLQILDMIGAPWVVKQAYCLHPILQSDDDFRRDKAGVIPMELIDAAILAMEYRWVANSYLSNKKVSDFVGFSCDEVREMLIADKVQNYKDFLIHHKATHPRSQELDEYFNNWFELLEISYNTIMSDLETYTAPR
jgi:hypothetical protein